MSYDVLQRQKKEINKHYGSPNTKYDERILIYGTQNKKFVARDRAGTIYINPWNNIEIFIAQPIFPSHIA